MKVPAIILAGALALTTATTASAQFVFFEPTPVVVVKGGKAKYYDPYYNAPKVKRAPVYYETTKVTKKGNKTTKKVTIKNQNGKVVYQNKTTKKKKK